MMPTFHGRGFRKDLKLAYRRGKDLRKLQAAVESLARGEPLSGRLRDHPLKGKLAGFRECHLEPDWLLIYQVDPAAGIIRLERTGTHSDLFG